MVDMIAIVIITELFRFICINRENGASFCQVDIINPVVRSRP